VRIPDTSQPRKRGTSKERKRREAERACGHKEKGRDWGSDGRRGTALSRFVPQRGRSREGRSLRKERKRGRVIESTKKGRKEGRFIACTRRLDYLKKRVKGDRRRGMGRGDCCVGEVGQGGRGLDDKVSQQKNVRLRTALWAELGKYAAGKKEHMGKRGREVVGNSANKMPNRRGRTSRSLFLNQSRLSGTTGSTLGKILDLNGSSEKQEKVESEC